MQYPTPHSNTSALPLTILCVDDSAPVLEICKGILEAGGYRVLCAGSGPEALSLLSLNVVDAVVLDHQMPEMTGIELASKMRRTGGALKIVMYSGTFRGDESMPGVDSCLSKGDGPIALRKLLDSILRQATTQAGQ